MVWPVQARAVRPTEEPTAGGSGASKLDVLFQLPWGERLRRRFRADDEPSAMVRFLVSHRADDLAAHLSAPPATSLAGEDESALQSTWGRLLTHGFVLKSFEGPVVHAPPLGKGLADEGKALPAPRGPTLSLCRLGRMEKLVVEITDF